MNVPKLRFKEFNDEYNALKLSDVAELTSSKRIYLSDYTDNGIPFYRGKEISELKLNKPVSDLLYISDEKYKEIEAKYGVPKENDILVTGVGTLGNIYRIPNNNKFYFKDGNLIWLKNIKQNSEYLEYNLEFNKKKLLDSAIGSTQKALTIAGLNKLSFFYPSTSEQSKVARTMQLIDIKINLQSKKIEDLKLFKLSKYSSVFSKSNNKIKLSDICIIEKGKQINSDLLIEKGNYYMLNGGILPSGYLNEYNTNENTITISEGGNSCGYVNFNKTKFWCGGHCYKIISSSVNSSYLYHLLKYNEKIIMDLRVGSGLPNIQKKDLEALKLSIHKNDEQLKIGILFDTFDKKINLETNKLNKFKELKKALMQVMFV